MTQLPDGAVDAAQAPAAAPIQVDASEGFRRILHDD